MTAGPGYRHGRTARRVLCSLVPVICPPEARALGEAIVDHMALTLGAVSSGLRRGFAAGLVAYDLGAVLRYRRRAQALRGADAERYYASWEGGPTALQRQLARAVNQLMSLACYEQPEMLAQLGYLPAPWIAQVSQRRLAVYRDDIRRQDAQILAPDPLRPLAPGARATRDPA